ncbi:MAG TPA: DUF1800 family protein [Candidatus Saccharimonadales bacterium]|nr:DUF1800 family protein [Candidatus Saccharimonadales bacterium]
MRNFILAVAAFIGAAFFHSAASASDPPQPQILNLISSNAQKTAVWTPYPAAQQYNLLSAGAVDGVFSNAPGVVSGNSWRGTNNNPYQFYKLGVTPMSSNALLNANLLNRIAYGPTPDDLERLSAIGPQAYINEQLAPESVVENLDGYTVQYVNAANPFPNTNWTFNAVTGTFSDVAVSALYRTNTLYMYLTKPGDVFMDDVQIHALVTSYTTNWTFLTNGSVVTTNTTVSNSVFYSDDLLTNGNFELAPTGSYPPGWTVSANHSASYVSPTNVCSGAQSLHMAASVGGTTKDSAIWQTFVHSYFASNHISTNIYTDVGTRRIVQCVLSFNYLPKPDSSILTLRLSGNGTITSAGDARTAPGWIYATATGLANATHTLYIYSSGAGEFYIDDMKLVSGTVAEAGPNLLRNGDFESPLNTNDWFSTTNYINSVISSTLSHSGNGSLRVIGTAGGSGSGNAISQTNIAGVVSNGTYTLSFWYLPSTRNRTITVRLSGSLLVASPDTSVGNLHRRLDTFMQNNYLSGSPTIGTYNTYGTATLADLRAWYIQNAVGSKRQLLEVLSQFLENHFVTEFNKSRDYLDQYYDDGTLLDSLAANWEYREMTKWRAALLRPDCTFYDLLKISAESPAMIVYLDTVNSRGDGTSIANENYARELFELFCMGVDNGYEQQDIVAQSRAWTGWSVNLVDPENIDNPFAPPSISYGFYPGVSSTLQSNIVGVWTFNYKTNNHGTNRFPVLSVWGTNAQGNMIATGPKLVPARFGAPWAGTSYQLNIPRRPTGTTNSIQDGYDVIRHLAFNTPMTAEYISVKLCRLLVHDEFPNPTTRPELPEYAFYDYTNPNMSAEARLVHDCMLAWWNSSPRGNMRAVIGTILASDLFRSHGGSLQKIKTPLEYCVSAVRALRSVNQDGSATASTDGYSIPTALSRMGGMSLFNRDAPDGYPETGDPWISAGTLSERLRFIQSLCTNPGATNPGKPGDAGASTLNPVALLQKKIPGSMQNAGAVADYFLGTLYPAEGKANLDLYRTAAISFLNTADNMTTNTFNTLPPNGTTYDTRVRGMVSYLMTLQRFHEQ